MINKQIEKLTQHDHHLIAELLKDNMPPSTIGKKFGVRAETVREIGNRAGLECKFKYRARKDTVKDEKIKQMLLLDRYSQKFIADSLGVCRTRVLKMQIELGLVEETVIEASKSKMTAKAKQVHRLCIDGMTIAEACKAVGGISTASYGRYKKALAVN